MQPGYFRIMTSIIRGRKAESSWAVHKPHPFLSPRKSCRISRVTLLYRLRFTVEICVNPSRISNKCVAKKNVSRNDYHPLGIVSSPPFQSKPLNRMRLKFGDQHNIFCTVRMIDERFVENFISRMMTDEFWTFFNVSFNLPGLVRWTDQIFWSCWRSSSHSLDLKLQYKW